MKTLIGYDSNDEPPRSARDSDGPEPPQPGQKVRIIDGPFADLDGIVETTDKEKSQVRVRISMFGRETFVKLDYWQIERLV